MNSGSGAGRGWRGQRRASKAHSLESGTLFSWLPLEPLFFRGTHSQNASLFKGSLKNEVTVRSSTAGGWRRTDCWHELTELSQTSGEILSMHSPTHTRAHIHSRTHTHDLSPAGTKGRNAWPPWRPPLSLPPAPAHFLINAKHSAWGPLPSLPLPQQSLHIQT